MKSSPGPEGPLSCMLWWFPFNSFKPGESKLKNSKETNKQTKNKIVVFKDQDWALLCSLSLSFWLPYFAKLINAFLMSLSVSESKKKERNKRKQLALWTETGRQRDDWDGKDVRSPLSLCSLVSSIHLGREQFICQVNFPPQTCFRYLDWGGTAPLTVVQCNNTITERRTELRSSSHCHAALTSFYHRVCLHASTVSM